MSGKNISFEDKKINKSNFYKNKKLLTIYNLNVNKILETISLETIMYKASSNDKNFMLKILIVIRQCLSRLMVISY